MENIHYDDIIKSVKPHELKINILAKTVSGTIPIHIYSPEFSWREIVMPDIVSITVSQGQHAAEIAGYEQYNFIMEVTQNMISMTGPVLDGIDPRKFIVMGKMGNRVDLYIFSVYKGVITTFQRDIASWGAELDGASTSGWKKGIDLKQ